MAPLLSAYFIEDVIEDQPVYCGIATSIFLVPFFRYGPLFHLSTSLPLSLSLFVLYHHQPPLPIVPSSPLTPEATQQPLTRSTHTRATTCPSGRYLFNRLGGVPASRSCIKEIRGMGASVSIVVGGVAEMFTACDEAEVVLLRSGFIREAVRNGFDIVPVFHFG